MDATVPFVWEERARSHGRRPPWITAADWGRMSVRERAAEAMRLSLKTTADAGVQATFFDDETIVEGLRSACQRWGLRGSGVKAELLARLNREAARHL